MCNRFEKIFSESCRAAYLRIKYDLDDTRYYYYFFFFEDSLFDVLNSKSHKSRPINCFMTAP